MKNGMVKYLSHEVEFVSLATMVLILLSILVFPLFIAFLPLAIIVGCSGIWKLDHLNQQQPKK